MWGILTGISVLFPLSNVLIKLIPLTKFEGDPLGLPAGLEFFSPEFVTVVTTLVVLFIVFWTFGQRHKFKSKRKWRSIRRQARLSFAVGLLSLILYFMATYGLYYAYWEPFGIEAGDPRALLGDTLMLLSYSGFFTLVTRAFMLLGMIEYFKQE